LLRLGLLLLLLFQLWTLARPQRAAVCLAGGLSNGLQPQVQLLRQLVAA
jgi:hypothetical protein